MSSPRHRPNVLAGPYLDRAVHRRRDEGQLKAALADPATLYVPVWRSRNLIAQVNGTLSAHFICGVGDLAAPGDSDPILLGEFRGRLCFAVEIAESETPAALAPAEFHDLRLIAGELPPEEAGLLAYARAMVLWRERHRYCGRCGARTVPGQAGHVLVCSDATCGTQQFPRIDPAIIVLITDGERVLLGRQAVWPAGRYSTIAGFVEPGESLEDAVIREVREETGVEVDAVEYHSSQPWPFPASLMLGFTAHATTTAIQLHDAELEDARWLSRAQIAAGEVALPTTHSVSFRLIEDWYNAGAPVPLQQEPGVRMWQPPRRRG